MTLSPIILFTYNRISSVKRTVESLQACDLAKDSSLVVFSDAAKNEVDKPLVESVRVYLKVVKGFKNIEIVEREANLGVDYNIIEGLKAAADLYGQFIVVEDDLVVTKNFLQFMNKALDFYASYSTVLSVNAFSFVRSCPNDYIYDVYFTQRSWSWGWATWAAKIKDVDWDVKGYDDFLNDRALQRHFNNGGSDLSRMLKNTMNGKIRAWDIRLFYYQFLNNYVSVYPVLSKVINIGFNENASNTFGYNRYKINMDDGEKTEFLFKKEVEIDEAISKSFAKVNNIQNRIKTRVFNFLGIK